jgi:hypothetical protein
VSVPIIGSQQQHAPETHVQVGVQGPAILLTIIRRGLDHHHAPMNLETAASVMTQLGQAIEHVAPGELPKILREWQRQLGQPPIKIGVDNGEVDGVLRGR